MEIRLDPEISKVFPDAHIRFVVVHGLRNAAQWPDVAGILAALEDMVACGEWVPATKEDPRVASWHDAYRAFGTNPNRFRPSVEALSRRLMKNHALPRINPAVDLYNYISVKHAVPAGAFDLDAIDGPVDIRFAKDGDTFVPLGEPDVRETPNSGEAIYAQGSRVLTRHWNYRDSDLTKVTENTRSAVFIFERISAKNVSSDELRDAQLEFLERVRPHVDHVHAAVVEADTPVTALAENESGLIV